jgi:enoyl-CoA hydratase/carnithine racemase
MSEFLRVERAGAIATLWIDRQAKMNTLTVAMRNEFPGIFGGLEADPAVRVIVVRGAGGKAFSAGGDVAEFLLQEPADLELWGDTLTSAERCRKPVIAAIDGFTMGAGLELAVACDFRIATLRSEFAFPEVRLGMIPGSGGTQRALRLIGMTRAKLFMMTGQRIPAQRAEAWGRRGCGGARARARRARAARAAHAQDGDQPGGGGAARHGARARAQGVRVAPVDARLR